MTHDIYNTIMKPTEEHKRSLSRSKKEWWDSVKKDPARLAKVKERMSRNNAKNLLGKKGKDHPGWKGGKYTDSRDGYVLIRDTQHPAARSDGYVLEHRLVMEKVLGRYLIPDEDVNHLNGKKDDNRIENLRLVRHFAHYEEMSCPKCSFVFHTR